ncbi:MAG: DUF4974 domain-containing protein [Tannerellaceae bacterium]|jgi:ferric-dicitrate binding protein FerR (iron transport regulator)|nr:DUF4974 domain-containing protein [Tannerellaceae bacterium]
MSSTEDKTNGSTDECSGRNSGETLSDKTDICELIERIEVSPDISAMGEEIRESILNQVHLRINKAIRRSVRIKISLAAASVVLLLCVSNYIAYKQGYRQLNKQIVQLVNPLGMQSSIVLSDGTKVILNAGTTLKYPTAFTGKNREVEIEGEAFFEVIHNTYQVFIVKAGNVMLQVLGTKFNLKAYEEEKYITITLEEGSVEINLENQKNSLRINTGQQLLFDKSSLTFSRKQVNSSLYTAWKEGNFYFNSMTLEDIARQLERHFNVHINITSDKLKHIIYTGDFIRKESLEQVLNVITADKRMHYKIVNDQVQISD